MDVFVFALSVIDLFGAVLILNGPKTFLIGSFIIYFAYMLLAKGVISIASSIGSNYYFDWLGVTDVIAGITLILISYNVSFSFFQVIGYWILFKACYCLMRTILGF